MRIASDGTILYRNEASEPLLEFWRCLQDVPVPDIARTCIEEAFNSGKVIHDEVRCCDKVFSLRYAPVTEAGYVNIYAHDITERRRAQDEMERIFNLTGYMVCVASMDGYFRKINSSFEETLGYSTEELLGRPFLDFVHPDDKKKTEDVIRENLASGILVIGFENRYRCKDGSYKWLSWTSRPIVEEGTMYAIAYDITERKRADELLRTSEANYRAIFESANDAIFIHDIEKGEILDFNPKMSEIFGYTRAEAENFTVEDLSSGEPGYTQQDAVEWIRKASDGTPQVFEWQCRHKSGRLFRAEVSLKRARIGGENRMLAIVRDISDRKS